MRHRKEPRRSEGGIDWSLTPSLLAGGLMVVLPLVFSFTGLDKFRLPKDVVLTLLVALSLPVLYLTARLRRPRPWGAWESLLGVSLAYVWLHAAVSTAPQVSLWAAVHVTVLVGLYWILYSCCDERFQRVVWLLFAAVSGLNAVLTVLQTHGMFPAMVDAGGETLAGRLNPAGLIGDVNSGGFLFGLVTLLLVPLLVEANRAGRRMLVAGLLALNLVGLAYTQTLTAFVALAACLALWLVFHHWWLLRHTRRVTRGLLLLWFGVAAGLTAAALAGSRSGIVDRLAEVVEQAREGRWTTVTAGREPVYRITWRMIREQPWLGRGLNTFGREFFAFRTGTEEGQSVRLIRQPGAFRETHNDYLQVWVELGLPGLLLLLGLLGWPLVRAWTCVRREKDRRAQYWYGVLALAVVYVLIAALAFFPLRLSLTGACVALILAGLRYHQNGGEHEVVGYSTGRPIWSVGAMTLMLAAAVFLVRHELLLWSANNAVGNGAFLLEQAASLNLPDVQRRMVADQVLARLQSFEISAARMPELYSLRGTSLLILGRYEAAARAYGEAAAYAPGPELYTNLGAACLALQDMESARRHLELALKYDPGYEKARQALKLLQDGHRR
jgi:O-antigen ligase